MPAIRARRRTESAPQQLWHDRDFRRLWLGQTASQLGEQTSQVTLPLIAVLALHAGATQLGILRAAGQAPFLLLSLFLGVWADRWRSRELMVISDAGRALVLAAVPAGYFLGLFTIPLLFVVAFILGVLSLSFDLSYQTGLVRLVDRDRLAEGNSLLEGSRSGARTGGPALGGAMVSALSAPIAVGASALSFVLSAAAIGRVRPTPAVHADGGRMRRQIHEGLRLVASEPRLRAVGLASAAFQFFFAALMTTYLLFLPTTLHLSGAVIGLALAAMGPGAVVGSLLSARLPGILGYGIVLVTAAAAENAALLCVPALHGSGAATIAALVTINGFFAACSQLVDVTIMSVRQAATPIRLQGRVVATINVVGMGLTPLGSLFGGYLAGELGPRAGLLVTALGLFLSPLVIAVSPLARIGRSLDR